MKYFLLVQVLEKLSDSTKKFLQRSHFPLHLKQPCISVYMVRRGRAKITLMFLALLKEGMIDPFGNILAREGELSMRCRWEYRIFPMLGKEGL